MNGYGTIASVIAGYKAGQISENMAKRLLNELGCDEDLASLTALAVGVVGAFSIGPVIGEAVSSIFEDLL